MKKFKQEKGSITLFVLVSMLFFVLFLTGIYMLNSSKEQTGISETARIKEIYEKDVNNIDDVYATLENDLIYYVTDKNGNKIPVPKGFSPITTNDQGTKETGFVIKNDTDGNEFVWVPVAGMGYSYDRYAFSREGWTYTQTKGQYDSVTNSYKISRADRTAYYYTEAMQIIGDKTELQSVTKYGGFYIGRYEVGVIGYTTLSTNNSNNSENWTGYSNGTAVVQKEKQVWNYITRDKAREIAEGMYSNNEAVISRLCSSYAWDTTLKFVETNYPDYPIKGSSDNYYGNYYDTTFQYTDLNGNEHTKAQNSSTLVPTGQTVAVNNIYDMGGNVWEWTTEVYSDTNNSCTDRGGSYYTHYASDYPSASRSLVGSKDNYSYIGFRSTLFL